MRPTKPRTWFTRLTKWTAHVTGRPITFVLAASVILAWALTGPIFAFSDTWQLVINTGTTIVTFLMVFLIQSTQNRDGEAVQVKLDDHPCDWEREERVARSRGTRGGRSEPDPANVPRACPHRP
jgi:low affinity Fe/Cu permease